MYICEYQVYLATRTYKFCFSDNNFVFGNAQVPNAFPIVYCTALTGSVNCLVTPGPTLGWPKIIKNVKTENIPLLCEYMDQVEKKSLKDYIVLINI